MSNILTKEIKETRRPQGVDVDLSYGGEGSLASRWALELDVAVPVTKLSTALKFYSFLSNK
ncbi:hypothetical protein NSQ77_13825 [Oceanobacillus sp. FSL K6-2867]|uniref:hypothetical protein n=1 Tax=Oceanobacillus sp. FSL K6-2867 TaxID=2954748 RepID=UPI0030DA92B0